MLIIPFLAFFKFRCFCSLHRQPQHLPGLAKRPKLLLCDEPTGALDYATGKAVLKLLQDMCRNTGMTVVIITHNSALTAMADRVIRVKNGTVSSVALNENPVPVEDIEW